MGGQASVSFACSYKGGHACPFAGACKSTNGSDTCTYTNLKTRAHTGRTALYDGRRLILVATGLTEDHKAAKEPPQPHCQRHVLAGVRRRAS